MEGLIRDLRFGLRTLWKNKSFSLLIVLTLGLAIGANTTIFSMVSMLILQPVPFANSEEVTFLWMSHPESNRPRVPVSLRDYLDISRQLTTFQGLSALRSGNLSLRTGDGVPPARMSSIHATPNFFPLMGVELFRGRNFLPEESKTGQGRVAILAHKTWNSRFGADDVLDREIFLDGVSYRIIGVLTPEMETGVFQETEIWLPLVTDVRGPESEERALQVLGRLKADQTIETAREEAVGVMGRLAEAYPKRFQGYRAEVLSLSDALFGQNGRIVLPILIVSVSFVLIIACSNVANMILARSLSRGSEIALRTALGARRLRILRQLLTESLILSGLGAVLGIVIAHWTLRFLVWISRGQGFFVSFSINRDVLLFALALGLLTPLFFGLIPGLRITRKDVVGELKESRGMAATGRLIGQKSMVAGQVALSFIMLVVAGLATQSVSQVT